MTVFFGTFVLAIIVLKKIQQKKSTKVIFLKQGGMDKIGQG